MPGLIAFHLYQDLPKADMAYPTLVNNVLPVPMVGFFGAVLFGAVISTFNGFLNSASTLFSMGIYRRIINQNAEPQQLVTVGRKFGFFIAIVSVLVAPWIANAPQGLYSWMKQLNGIYNVPLVTIIIMGFFFPRIPALAAKVAMGIGIISYITINYLVKFDFHFLYVLACTFCINVVVMLVIGTASSFGYGIWDSVKILGMQFLDFFDFLTNSVMMPIAALATCILILRVVGFRKMDAEIEQSSDFKRKKLYHFFLKYLACACVIIILLSSIANVMGWISL